MFYRPITARVNSLWRDLIKTCMALSDTSNLRRALFEAQREVHTRTG
jgi:hypothetical protein